MTPEGIKRLDDAIAELPSPTPWTLPAKCENNDNESCLYSSNGNTIFCEGHDFDQYGFLKKQDAELIVTAVNAYDQDQQTIRALLWTLAEITHEVIEMGEYPITAELSTAREFASRLLTRLGTCKS